MRGGENGKQEIKTYTYRKCPVCQKKLHIYAALCLNCGADFTKGTWLEKEYHSNNPEDAIYSRTMNKIEKCIKCPNVLQRGNICERQYCFGTTRGYCESCRKENITIFDCCQEVQKENGVVREEDIRAFIEEFRQIAFSQQQEYFDEIPF